MPVQRAIDAHGFPAILWRQSNSETTHNLASFEEEQTFQTFIPHQRVINQMQKRLKWKRVQVQRKQFLSFYAVNGSNASKPKVKTLCKRCVNLTFNVIRLPVLAFSHSQGLSPSSPGP